MKKKALLLMLASTVVLTSTSLSTISSMGMTDGVAYAAKSDVKGPNKVSRDGVVVKKGYTLWQNFDWKKKGSSTSLLNKKVHVKYAYKHKNGSLYYSVYNTQDTWLGYINSNGIKLTKGEQGPAIKFGKYVTITNKNYNIYSNFNWRKKSVSADYMTTTLEARYQYKHVNGDTYYSLYDATGEWVGYINGRATQVGNNEFGGAVYYNKYVMFEQNDYSVPVLYSDLAATKIKKMGNDIADKPYLAKYVYAHFNSYYVYSLYDYNGKWVGYTSNGLQVDVGASGKGEPINRQVTVNDQQGTVYQNFNWVMKNELSNLKGKELTAKRYYKHANGNTYYSLFDKANTWQGYVISDAITTNKPKLSGVKDQTLYLSDKPKDAMGDVKAVDYQGKTLPVTIEGQVDVTKAGIYPVTYIATDDQGNDSKKKATITVIDDFSPLFEGVEDVKMLQSTKGFDVKSGVVAKDYEGTVLDYSVEGAVTTGKVGTYILTYKAVDKRKHDTVVKRRVEIVEAGAPVLSGISDRTIKKSEGTFDPLKGIKAVDSSKTELPITVEGAVDMSKSGIYSLTYTATDDLGQSVSEKCQVTVVNDLPPVMNGVEDMQLNISVGLFDAKEGVTATDSDGNAIDYSVTGEVVPTKVGTYTVTYAAVDSLGNKISVKRNIKVVEIVAESVTLDGQGKVRTNETFTLESRVFPADTSNKQLTYTSSNPEVAVVDEQGNVSTFSEGTTVIRATTMNGVVGEKTVVVDNTIVGRMRVNSTVNINGIIKSAGFTFNNQDSETLYVEEVAYSDGGRPSTFSKERMESEGIDTQVQPGSQFNFSVSSKLGWFADKMVISLKVRTASGVEQIFEARP